ncbi:MAG: HPr family phosphocarrier protein [Roseburia sp.]|nr:HPr family phosphocarrier protein [Roseburia sp.]MCM1280005.1 HPr family phosphocarrier protein [Robinsoniella sp.]
MTERKIMLRMDEVKDFVSAASKCDFDIDIFYNRYSVDAKSILGVMGLDLRQPLTVRCNGHSEEFESYLNHFSIAC